MPHAEPTPAPVFVGGTGRSGTTIVGELIGASEAYALAPIELRFHVDKGGLGDLAQGTVTLDQFEARLRESWYMRPPSKNGPRGVHVVLDRPRLGEALERLRTGYAADPWTACGTFLDDVVAPLCRAQGSQSWVEMTPPNAKNFHLLGRMLPSAQFVHMVRDGRDVASSVARRTWGPDDMPAAIRWWGNQMKAINRAITAVGPSRVLTLRLESLVGPQREEAFAELTNFLGLTSDDAVRGFFESHLTQQMSHAGRWRAGLDEQAQEQVEELYAAQLERLENSGRPLPPVL